MPAARVVRVDQRVAAAALVRECLGVDLLQHEQQSGAEVSFLVWPDTDPIQAVAGVVVYRDGTGFFYLPVGERHPDIIDSIYSALPAFARANGVGVLIALVGSDQPGFADELVSRGFERVGFVLSMRSTTRESVETLARFAEPPTRIGEAPEDDPRLVQLIERTYVGSLSDPALGSHHRAAGFVQRLRNEHADYRDRFIYAINGVDAAVCLLSRNDAARCLTVRYLGVATEFRGRKLGGKLLAASLSAVWSERYDFASVDVDEGNHFAVTVYQELGFREVARAEEFAMRLT